MRIVSELPGLTGDRPVHRIGGADLCDLLGITPGALTGLCKRGLAVRLGHDAYDLTATVTAYVAHLRGTASGRGGEEQVLTLTGQRARLAKAQAEAQELKNAAIKGDLVPLADVRREWLTTATDLRSAIMAIPARISARLGLDREGAAALEAEMRGALEGLGNDE